MTVKPSLRILGLIALACGAAPCMAADTAFTGLALGATAGLSHNSVDYSGYIAGKSSSRDDAIAGVNASYGFALSNAIVLSVGAAYVLNTADFGQVTYQNGGSTVYVNGKLKDHTSVFVAPGVILAPQWLGYAKLGYHWAHSEFNDTLMGPGSQQHHGAGYGLGISYAATRQIEVSAEVEHVDLSRGNFALSSGDPTLTQFNVGVNYRF